MQITSRRAANSYMKMVENSDLGSSDEVCLNLFSNTSTGAEFNTAFRALTSFPIFLKC